MADSETVTVRHKHTLEQFDVGKAAVPFFTNNDYEVVEGNDTDSGTDNYDTETGE